MIAAIVLMAILCILMVIACGISLFVAFYAGRAFLAIDAQHDEYKRYLNIILDEISESSEIFRTELARKLSLNIPETKELNGMLHHLETRIQSLKINLKEFLSEE